jgi:hypothetical protein
MDHVANYPVIRKLGEGRDFGGVPVPGPVPRARGGGEAHLPESLRDPARGRLFRKLFFTEASLAGKLDHPHIAQIFDAGIGEDSGYIVMEYVPAAPWSASARRRTCCRSSTRSRSFSSARARSPYAHKQGVTHRDIKPGNLLYAAAPTDVRVGDFGLALNLGAETTQITGVGSPAYMSPEQIREELVDHRTDIYSLGVVMYQMLTGKLPFQGTNKFSMIYQITQFEPAPPSSHRHEVPEALDRIVRRAMHKDSRDRYQTADEFADELVEALRSGLGAQRRIVFGDADKFAALRNMPFFRRFAEPELWELVRVGLWERVAAGTELVREGEPGDFFCLLVEGEARVTEEPQAAHRARAGRMLRRDGLPVARPPRARRHRHHLAGFARGAHPHRRPREGHRFLPQQRRPRLHRHPGRAPQPREHPPDVGLIMQGFRKEGAPERAGCVCRRSRRAGSAAPHVRVPRVLGHGVQNGKSFILLERLELMRGDYAAMGRMLAQLHRQTGPRFGWQRDNYIGLSPQQNGWCGTGRSSGSGAAWSRRFRGHAARASTYRCHRCRSSRATPPCPRYCTATCGAATRGSSRKGR